MTKYVSVFLAIVIFACAGSKEAVKETPVTIIKSKYDESFDPMTLQDDDIVIGPENTTGPGTSENVVESQVSEEKKRREVNGFRVQILATSNIETASLTEQEATDRFERLGHVTYLLFEAPLYKVRLGDCVQRTAADELRDLALSYGYTGAFVVKTKVIVEQ